jgi:hypothetical protein
MILLQHVTYDHCVEMELRQSDLEELEITNPGKDPLEVLLHSCRMSQLNYAAVDIDTGSVIAIFGVAFGNGYTIPWMLSSPDVKAYGRQAIRIARRWLRDVVAIADGGPIGNFIAKNNTSARKYIQALGFVIEPLADNEHLDFFYLPQHV